jgi:hypothetical protein
MKKRPFTGPAPKHDFQRYNTDDRQAVDNPAQARETITQ